MASGVSDVSEASEAGPVDKTVVRTSSKTGETFTFFFGRDCAFSQWHSAEFRVADVEYNCAEQYMMHQKAGKPQHCREEEERGISDRYDSLFFSPV